MQNCAYIIFRDKTLESFGEFLLYIKKKPLDALKMYGENV